MKKIIKLLFSRFDKSCLKGFSIVFLFSDWLKSNHLKVESNVGFLDIFSRHICCTVAETERVINYATSHGAKNVQKIKCEAAEMILDLWNQQVRDAKQ